MSAFERWKQFSEAAGLDIPEDDLRAIAETLDRLLSETRRALRADLGFTEPVLVFQFPEGER